MTGRGFILGKFLPPHLGHLFLCETALHMSAELTILVCSLDAEPVPGFLRANWMKELLPAANILHLHRDMPQEPDDHVDFWEIWRATIMEHHPKRIDRVFGSETYIFRLAQELGATPVLVDPHREVFPVSGSAIRRQPASHWPLVPPCVRPYYQKRLCLLGPESVGKTCLTVELATKFGTRVMPEYGRTYDVFYKQSLHAKGADWRAEDLLAIAQTHKAMQKALAPHAGPLVIEDTDALQTAIWAEFLLGTRVELLEQMWSENPADCYFLLSPDVEWIDDGVRYAGDETVRRWFFEAAVTRLDAFRVPYDTISGADWCSRTERAISLARARFNDLLLDN